jgi:spore cortex biosynthesis protein YabQ
MSIQIVQESGFFVYSMAIGVLLSVLYDLIRIWRRVIRHNKMAVALEDLLFWIVTLFLIFFLFYDRNDGVLRWFTVAGVLLGIGIYKKIFGEHLVEFMSTILKWVLNVVIRFILAILKPFLWLKKKLTHAIKLVKIKLYKHKKDNVQVGESYESKNL